MLSSYIEGLEERKLLAWGTIPQLIGQDLAVARYANIDGRGQVIASIDSGLVYTHPKLQSQVFWNSGETAGNGKDDDGNGFVDDTQGWDFVFNDNRAEDVQGHGETTSSILVAQKFVNSRFDGKEYQGIAPGAKVLPLRVSASDLSVGIYKLEAALQYVIKNRVRFNITAVNMSLAVPGEQAYVIADELKTLGDAGVFMVSVSGNGGGYGTPSYPASASEVFAAGGVNPDGSINSVSTRGPGTDILAPGNQVPYLDMGDSAWTGGAGTSYAAPHITAAGVLIRQVNRNWTPAQIMSILQDSGRPVYDSLSKMTFKLLNINAALDLAVQRNGGLVPPSPTPMPTPTPTPPPAGASSPFSGTPIALPATIQAENFDKGGQNVAWYDNSSGNAGGVFRTDTDVDIQPSSDTGGGYIVGFTRAGEWMKYSLSQAASGTFDLSARVSSQGSGGSFHIEIDSVNKSGTMTIPDTGGWNTWKTLTVKNVSLGAGNHVMKVVFDGTGSLGYVGNFNWFSLTPASTTVTPPPPVTSGKSAFNTLSALSADSMQGIVKGPQALEYIEQGDWVKFAGLDFGSAGATTFNASVAIHPSFAGRQVQVRIDGVNGPVIGTLTLGNTGSWTNYVTQRTGITRTTGVHDVYLTFTGASYIGNIAAIRFA